MTRAAEAAPIACSNPECRHRLGRVNPDRTRVQLERDVQTVVRNADGFILVWCPKCNRVREIRKVSVLILLD